ncbi:heat-inducible transcriptional repressor HrcA [Deltaproteobacteria bacterium TL4]
MSTKQDKNQKDISISERMQMVLNGVIDCYIQRQEPIGSRTLSKLLNVELSPATIRNTMTDLSEIGYLIQLHTSGGRIPTCKAYRWYVDSLGGLVQAPPRTFHDQINELMQPLLEIEDTLQDLSILLSRQSGYFAFVTTPNIGESIFRHVEFILLGTKRILAVIVDKLGIVHKKVIPMTESLSQGLLVTLSNYINTIFIGQRIRDVQQKIVEQLVTVQDRFQSDFAQIVRISRKAFDIALSFSEMYVSDTFHTLAEFDDETTPVLTPIKIEGHKLKISKILTQLPSSQKVQVLIGSENLSAEFSESSMIVASYTNEGRRLGDIGVLGPLNMDYSRVIPIVDDASNIISKFITEHIRA